MSRSLVAHSLRFNRKRHPDEAIAPSSLDGVHLFDYMEQFFERCSYEDTRDDHRQTMIQKQSFERIDCQSCLMHLSIARWGEEYRVLNPSNYGDIRYHIKRNDPLSLVTRAYCFVPLNGETAFFFSEYADRSSAGQGYLGLMRRDFVHSMPAITLNASRVFGAENWLETAMITELRITVKRKAEDRADRTSSYSGVITHTVKPDKRSLWGKNTLLRFLGKTEEERRNTLVEVADSLDLDIRRSNATEIDGKLTLLGQDGKSVTFSLSDDPRAPFMFIPINNPDNTALTADQFVEKCASLVEDYSNRI